MKVTSKGQVTIPLEIREKLQITPSSEVEFIEEKGRVYLRKKSGRQINQKLRSLVGVSNVGMTTEQILALTRS